MPLSFAREMRFPELSSYTQVPRRTLYLLAANRADTGFPAYRVGREWRAELGQVLEWLIESYKRGETMVTIMQRIKNQAAAQKILH